MSMTPDPRLAALRANDIANLRNRIAASRQATGYQDRQFVDVPTHMLESLLDALAAAEGEKDQKDRTLTLAADRFLKVCSDRDECMDLARRSVEQATKDRDALAARLAGAERVVALVRQYCAPAANYCVGDYDDHMAAALRAYDEAGGEGRGTV